MMGDFSSYLLNYRRLTDRASRVKDFEESLFKDWLSASSRGRSGQRTGKSSMELELEWGHQPQHRLQTYRDASLQKAVTQESEWEPCKREQENLDRSVLS